MVVRKSKKTKKRIARKPQVKRSGASWWFALAQNSWLKASSILLTVGAIAGVFWGLENHWVNFPFHRQSSDMVVQTAKSKDKGINKKELIANELTHIMSNLWIYKEMLQERESEAKIIEGVRNDIVRVRQCIEEMFTT